MFPCSADFEAALKASGRHFYTKAVINGSTTLYGDGTDGAVVDMTWDNVMDTDEIVLGSTPSSSCKMTIRLPSTALALNNGTFEPYVGMMINGAVEWIRLGKFYITEVKTDNAATATLTGFDSMYLLNGEYSPTVSFPATVTQVMTDICNQTGVANSAVLSNITLDVAYQCTMREMVGWIAGLHGRSAYIGREYDDLQFHKYTTDQSGQTYIEISANEEYMNGVTLLTADPFVVHSITSGTEDNVLVTGNGVGLTFSNPYMTQAILDSIGSEWIGLTYRPLTCEWRGNPCLDAGDAAFIEYDGGTVVGLVMSHTLTVGGGMKDAIRSDGKSDAAMSFSTSPTQQKINQVFTMLQSAIAQATALINGARGGIFEVTDTDSDGVNDGWVIKQSPDPNYMGKVIVANYQGIGFSNDGGATYGVAITTDGQINGEYIAAGTINADTLNVGGNESDPFSNYVYIGRRRPNDATTDMVIRIGVASQQMVQEMRGNRTSIFKRADVETYINAASGATEHADSWLDSKALMYYSDTDYVLLNLGSFRIGNMLMQATETGGVKFIKAV
ncbi:MAG: hypothetical protein J6W10_08155 [Kiritimatiellae bacterium]|nr:hypothetical protein [Kiritimatiellia bacterium]